MEFGTHWQRWWQRLRGEAEPVVKPDRRAAEKSVPAAARTATRIEGSGAAGELNLSVEAAPTAAKTGKGPRHRSAGFDPYSNSGGHSKARGWDSVTRK